MDILRVVSLVLQQHVMEIAEEKEPLREGASECDLSSKSDWIFSIKILPLAVLCRKCPRIAWRQKKHNTINILMKTPIGLPFGKLNIAVENGLSKWLIFW